jgi:hypothetical protein
VSLEDWDREEHERQRTAALALKSKIETAAAVQQEARRLAEADARFADDSERLARLDAEMRGGKPVEVMAMSDVGFLLGPDARDRLQRTYGASKRIRWRKACESMPRPPAGSSQHVQDAYERLLRKVYEGKQPTARTLPKQSPAWYQELARRELGTRVTNHVRACSEQCGAEAWAFVLDMPTFLPPGAVFDPAGNVKATKDRPEAEADSGS